MEEKFISSKQAILLPNRIRKAEETNATSEIFSYFSKLEKNHDFKPLKIILVGAGGSYPAALCVAHSIRDQLRTPNVEVYTPQTALRIIQQFDQIFECDYNPSCDLVIGISYSGNTPDIQAVSKACKNKHFPFLLITGANKEELSKKYEENDMLNVVSYFNPDDKSGKEKGMISMASTLIPAILFNDHIICSHPPKHHFEEYQKYLKAGKQFVSNLDISKIAESIKRVPVVHLFYEWSTLSIATDIESKFIESGIANVVMHEKKNFSHGRGTVLYNQDFGLIINVMRYQVAIPSYDCKVSDIKFIYKNDYEKNLANFLKDICNSKSAYYLEIGNGKFDADICNIEEMCKVPYLITAIGESLGVDISRPLTPYPEKLIDLYNYEGAF